VPSSGRRYGVTGHQLTRTTIGPFPMPERRVVALPVPAGVRRVLVAQVGTVLASIHPGRDEVTVVVTNFAGPASEQIRVIGEAAKPQALPYRKGLTLLDVMITVGGLTPFADGNRATISRGAEGGKSYSVRLRDLVTRGEIAANVEMRPGDILIIPQSWF